MSKTPPRKSLFLAIIAGNLQAVSSWIEDSTKGLDEALDLEFTAGNDTPGDNDNYWNRTYRIAADEHFKDLGGALPAGLFFRNVANIPPYLLAILCGRIEMIHLFEKNNEEHQIDLDMSPSFDALSYAVQSQNLQTVQLFVSRIENDFDVNQRDRDGNVLIHLATESALCQENTENNPLVKILQIVIGLKGLRINETEQHHGRTSLHNAARNGDAFVAKMLLVHGANVNQLDNGGWTALHAAAEAIGYDYCSYDIFRVLLGHPGTNANQKVVPQSNDPSRQDLYHQGLSPLHFLLRDAYHPAVIPILVQHGADVNQSDRNGLTPFHYALHTSKEAIGHFLATESVLLNQVDKNGNSYLVLVAGSFKQEHGFDEETQYGDLVGDSSYGCTSSGYWGGTHNLSTLLADPRVERPVAALAAAVSSCNVDAVMILLHCCIGRDILFQWFHQQRWLQKITLYKHAVAFCSEMPEEYQKQHQEIVTFDLCRLNTAHALDSESALRVFNNQWPALVADRIESFVHSNRYVRRTLKQVKNHFISTINDLFKVTPSTTNTTTRKTIKIDGRGTSWITTNPKDLDERLTILQRACFAKPSHYQVEAIRFLLEFDEIEVNRLCLLTKNGKVIQQTALSIAVDALEKLDASPPNNFNEFQRVGWQQDKIHLNQVIEALENAGGIVHVEE